MATLFLDLGQVDMSLESVYIRQAVARRWIVAGIGYWPVRVRMRANEVTAIVINMAKKIRLRFSNRLPAAVSMRFRIQSAAT
jgi:hypothetical protein